MIENNDFPWYLQQSAVFIALYNGFFDVAVMASPLGIGDALNIDAMQGEMLFRLGSYYGMQGTPAFNDGLIFDTDTWSETKTWTGGISTVGETFYRNFLKAKTYAYGRVYCLETLKGVLDRVFDGLEYSANITEDYMAISINITADSTTIRDFIDMRAFDLFFIGKPVGIKVEWTYTIAGEEPEKPAPRILEVHVPIDNSFSLFGVANGGLAADQPRIELIARTYDGENYAMYVSEDLVVEYKGIFPLYSDKELTNVVAYVENMYWKKETVVLRRITGSQTMASLSGMRIWFPELGEGFEDRKSAKLEFRWRDDLPPYTRKEYDIVEFSPYRQTETDYGKRTYYCSKDYVGYENTWVPLYSDSELQHISMYFYFPEHGKDGHYNGYSFAPVCPTLQDTCRGGILFYDVDAGETEEQASYVDKVSGKEPSFTRKSVIEYI